LGSFSHEKFSSILSRIAQSSISTVQQSSFLSTI
jgi:hypothetical protein